MAAKWKQLLVLSDLCRQNVCSRLALEKLALDVLWNRLEKNSFFPMFLNINKKRYPDEGYLFYLWVSAIYPDLAKCSFAC